VFKLKRWISEANKILFQAPAHLQITTEYYAEKSCRAENLENAFLYIKWHFLWTNPELNSGFVQVFQLKSKRLKPFQQ
jgi:hypothetical protein